MGRRGGAAFLFVVLMAPAAAGAEIRLFPSDRLYPHYTADPRSPEFGLVLLSVPEAALADSGEERIGLKLGGRFGLLRVHPRGEPEAGWQLDIHAGFLGQFDLAHSLDNVGWDGLYGFLASRRWENGLAFQLGTKHVSAHVGDEYAERTGRLRIGYTRDEVAAGLAWSGRRGERLYAEGGWNYRLKEHLGQQPGRLQLGAELHRPTPRERLGWFAALDLEAMEERDWQVDGSLHLGLAVPAGDRRWRIGVALYDGRVPLGEFFAEDEPTVGFGLWLEP